MSYILDALKKSEKERLRKNTPDILSVQEPVLQEKKKRSVWRYLLIIVLLANTALTGYWIIHSGAGRIPENSTALNKKATGASESLNALPAPETETKPSAPATQTTAVKSSELPSKVVSVTPPVAKTEKRVEDIKQKNSGIQYAPVKIPGREKQQPSEQQAKTSQQPAAVQPPVPVQSEPVPVPVPVPNKLYTVNELPQSVQQTLPSINMSIFMYSEDPASRMVRINGQTLREGQSISDGVKLEEIRPDGIIVNYKNFKLHIGQKQ